MAALGGLGTRCRVRRFRPEPSNGWTRVGLLPGTAGVPMVNLADGRLQVPAAAAPGLPACSELLAADAEGPWYLPSMVGGQAFSLASTLAKQGVECLIQVGVEDALSEAAGLAEAGESLAQIGPRSCAPILVLDPLSMIGSRKTAAAADGLRRVLDSGLCTALRTAVVLPLFSNLSSEPEMRDLIDQIDQGSRQDGYQGEGVGVVPVSVQATPREIRALLDWRLQRSFPIEEKASERLFHAESTARHLAAAWIAGKGLRWWFEPPVEVTAGGYASHRSVAARLALVADLGDWLKEGTGFVEGHLQAARRIEGLTHQIGVLLRDDHVRLLDWLDPRARTTLERWYDRSDRLLGDPPILEDLRQRFVADSRCRYQS